MSGTFTQLNIQLVFAVRYRMALIQANWKEDLHKFISGLIQSRRHKTLQINSMPDHIHILVGQRPADSLSSLVQSIKSESSKWINETKRCSSLFRWQEGYGAFSYSQSDVANVIRYIQNQDSVHVKKTFLEEYRQYLDLFEVDYNDKYIFTEPR